jgi:hypothetical protein
MKFKASVAVLRNGRHAYYATADTARRLVLSGFAQRRGQVAVELPGDAAPETENLRALLVFLHGQPDKQCFGAHTPVSKDRLSYAPCFFNAGAGLSGNQKSTWRSRAWLEVEAKRSVAQCA